MKHIILLVSSIIFMGCSSLSPEDTEVTVEKSIEKISIILSKVNERLPQNTNLSVNEALITLHARQSVATSGKLEVIASGEVHNGATNSMRLQFNLVPTDTSTPLTHIEDRSFNELLMHIVKAITVIENDSTFKLRSISIQLAMNISKGIDGGVNIDFLGVGLGAQTGESYESGNSIEIVLIEKNQSID